MRARSTGTDQAPQLRAFLEVPGTHRKALEQQREDIEITPAEIAQHEARCRGLLRRAARRARRQRRAPV